MKRKIRLTESDLRRIVMESVDKILSKPMKKNTVEDEKKIADYLKDGNVDLAAIMTKYYPDHTADDANAIMRKYYPDHTADDAKRRLERKVCNFPFRKTVKESINKVLKENAYTEAGVWDLLERLEGFMSDKDIIARIISRIGPDEAVRILKDIMTVEGNGDWDA